MKKLIFALILGTALMVSGITYAEEYIMSPGDQLDIYVAGHPDISSTGIEAETNYTVRPDGKIEFPFIGVVDTTGKTVEQFTAELTNRLSEYVVKPNITVNISKLGTTRVFVFGEVKKQGSHELTKSHRVLDALGASGGFTKLTAKKGIYLIRNDEKEPVRKINMLNYLKKGDLTQNIVLKEGDCLYLTSNHKFLLTDIVNLVNKAMHAWYYERRIEQN